MRAPSLVKECSCGMRYYVVPVSAKRFDDDALGGWYFDCERCHSTNYVPFETAPPAHAGQARTGTLLACFACLTLMLLALYCARTAPIFGNDSGEQTKAGDP